MQGQEALDFLDRSLVFTEQLHHVVSEGLRGGTTDLWELTERAACQLGPYLEFGHELVSGVRAHIVAP